MPEKTMEKTVEKVGTDARRYMREAEDVAQDAIQRTNEFIETTIKYSFDNFGMMMREGLELNKHTQNAMEEMMTVYRRYYSEGIKSWEGYFNNINKIIFRPNR